MFYQHKLVTLVVAWLIARLMGNVNLIILLKCTNVDVILSLVEKRVNLIHGHVHLALV